VHEKKVPEYLLFKIQEKWGDTSCLCNKCLSELIEKNNKDRNKPIHKKACSLRSEQAKKNPVIKCNA